MYLNIIILNICLHSILNIGNTRLCLFSLSKCPCVLSMQDMKHSKNLQSIMKIQIKYLNVCIYYVYD